jgi:hypothetical protein
MWNKKGELTVETVILIAIGVIFLVVMVFFVLVPKINSFGSNMDSYQGCKVFNNKGGCFNEADKLTKEDAGSLCFNNTGGCKKDISWCCYTVA